MAAKNLLPLLTLTGAGRAYLELSRKALSRCFDEPKALDAAGDTYAKALVRPGDEGFDEEARKL